MADPQLRARVPATGSTVTVLPFASGTTTDTFPAKEWCISDDVLNVADSCSLTIANIDGANLDRFDVGQRIEVDEMDPDVADGQWLRVFVGRITEVRSYSDVDGSNIMITAMDLGWHLTACHGRPHKNLNGVTLQQLLQVGGLLIDSSWGFAPTDFESNNSLNTRLKQGRAGVDRVFQIQFGAVLPYIQIEVGQAPYDILRTYMAREGLLINVGTKGELILFRPDYTKPADYSIQYHGSNDARKKLNNVESRPSLRKSIDGLYSETQCWSTLTSAQAAAKMQTNEDPNASFVKTIFKADGQGGRPENPLPFRRIHAFMDTEAISPIMRANRAIWKWQMDAFNSWQYECEVRGHSQKLPGRRSGALYASNTMISVDDSVNGVAPGSYYLQSVRRSMTVKDGAKTHLMIRKPGLLNPDLTRQIGGGAKAVQL